MVVKQRGSPFVLLAVLLSSWVAGRTLQYQTEPALIARFATASPMKPAKLGGQGPERTAPAGSPPGKAFPVLYIAKYNKGDSRFRIEPFLYHAAFRPKVSAFASPSLFSSKSELMDNTKSANNLSPDIMPSALALAQASSAAAVIAQNSDTPSRQALFLAHRTSRLSFYAYSFWRDRQNATISPVSGQYGASQTAIIGAYRLSGRLDNVSLLWRYSHVPSAPAQSELAIGLRVQPLETVPATIALERRVQADGLKRFSVTVAGGRENIALPARLKLAGFGQVGLLSRGTSSFRDLVFYDASVKVARSISEQPTKQTAIGAGLWAGGQTGAHRIDIGPTVGGTFQRGKISVRIDADWRFRIKGSAQPGSGPAITLSTSF